MSDSSPTGGTAAVPPAGPRIPPVFKDRRAGLIVFGILLLLMALLCLGSAALQVLMLVGFESLIEGAQSELDPGVFGFAAAFYLLIAVVMAWLGIGSIRCRRWARALLLVLSALALVSGVLGSIYLVAVFASMSEHLTQQAGNDEAAAIVPYVMGCIVVFVGFVYIVLPGAFFLFYRSPHVKATCERHDPTPRWTDRYRPPVLAGGLVLFFYALVFFAPVLGMPIPFFGRLLTGVTGWLCAMGLGLLAAFLGLAYLRFERWAWIGSVVYVAATGLSAYLTFRRGGLAEMYEAMGYSDDELALIESMGNIGAFPTLVLVSVVLVTSFFLWLGRYFTRHRRA